MATKTPTTRTLETFGAYSVVLNTEEDDYPFEVWDLDGGVMDNLKTRYFAVAVAKGLAHDDRIERLRGEIEEAAAECDDADALAAALALLKK